MSEEENIDSICGLCGKPGAGKKPHPEHWPGETIPITKLVHAACEDRECARAYMDLPDTVRQDIIDNLRKRFGLPTRTLYCQGSDNNCYDG